MKLIETAVNGIKSMVLKPRIATLQRDGWCLVSRNKVETHLKKQIKVDDAGSTSLKEGDMVKLLFRTSIQAFAMWVEVVGCVDGLYRGILKSTPFGIFLSQGAHLWFTNDHVLERNLDPSFVRATERLVAKLGVN